MLYGSSTPPTRLYFFAREQVSFGAEGGGCLGNGGQWQLYTVGTVLGRVAYLCIFRVPRRMEETAEGNPRLKAKARNKGKNRGKKHSEFLDVGHESGEENSKVTRSHNRRRPN